ncbi:SCO1431 family membrane protein [Streptomyces sp. NBC_00239]|uniref:SCO1431 family membrane protein n=1 Tax=Streptomyces sp. NBC_00239 TaxID=2903640 RepID=UPI002E2C6C42|nr:SCO1431 family membrane protein [Streptomyces sp. NBC_00239]
MNTTSAAAAAPASLTGVRESARTGGPDDRPKWLEHVLGWTLVVVLAMFVTQTGLM